MYVYIYIYMDTHVYVYIYIYIYMCVCVCTRICIDGSMDGATDLPACRPAGLPTYHPYIHAYIHTYVRTCVHTHVRTWRTSSASVFDATQKSVSARRTFGCQALRVCCRPWLRIRPLWTVLWGWQLASTGFRGFLLGLYTEHQVNDVRRQLNIIRVLESLRFGIYSSGLQFYEASYKKGLSVFMG